MLPLLAPLALLVLGSAEPEVVRASSPEYSPGADREPKGAWDQPNGRSGTKAKNQTRARDSRTPSQPENCAFREPFTGEGMGVHAPIVPDQMTT